MYKMNYDLYLKKYLLLHNVTVYGLTIVSRDESM